jgi:hypothetical protein
MIVDIVRLVVYSLSFHHLFIRSNMQLLSIALAASMVGIFLGAILLKKITIDFIQKIIVILLYLLGILLVLGVI